MEKNSFRLSISNNKENLIISQTNKSFSFAIKSAKDQDILSGIVDDINLIEDEQKLDLKNFIKNFQKSFDNLELNRSNILEDLKSFENRIEFKNFLLKINKLLDNQKKLDRLFNDNIHMLFKSDLKKNFLNIFMFLDDELNELKNENHKLNKKIKEMKPTVEKVSDEVYETIKKIINKKEKVIKKLKNEKQKKNIFLQIKNSEDFKLQFDLVSIIHNLEKKIQKSNYHDDEKNNNLIERKDYISSLKSQQNGISIEQYISIIKKQEKNLSKINLEIAEKINDLQKMEKEENSLFFIEDSKNKIKSMETKKKGIISIIQEGNIKIETIYKENLHKLKYCNFLRKKGISNLSERKKIILYKNKIKKQFDINDKHLDLEKLFKKNRKYFNYNNIFEKFLQKKKDLEKEKLDINLNSNEIEDIIDQTNNQKKLINKLLGNQNFILKDLKESEKEMKEFKEDLKKNIHKKEVLNSDKELLKNNLHSLSFELKNEKENILLLEKQLEEKKKMDSKKNEEIEKLINKLKSFKKNVKDLKKNKKNLKKDLQEKDHQLEKINKKNQDYLKTLEKLKQKNIELKKKYEEQFESLEKLFGESFNNYQLLFELQKKEKIYNRTFKDQEKQITEKTKIVNKLNSKIFLLEERLKQLMKQQYDSNIRTNDEFSESINNSKFMKKINILESTLEQYKITINNLKMNLPKNYGNDSGFEKTEIFDEDELSNKLGGVLKDFNKNGDRIKKSINGIFDVSRDFNEEENKKKMKFNQFSEMIFKKSQEMREYYEDCFLIFEKKNLVLKEQILKIRQLFEKQKNIQKSKSSSNFKKVKKSSSNIPKKKEGVKNFILKNKEILKEMIAKKKLSDKL